MIKERNLVINCGGRQTLFSLTYNGIIKTASSLIREVREYETEPFRSLVIHTVFSDLLSSLVSLFRLMTGKFSFFFLCVEREFACVPLNMLNRFAIFSVVFM